MNIKKKPILVTGADTGIGRQTVETLAQEGYQIYAGVFFAKNIEILNKIPNVSTIQIDVTNPKSINDAKSWISSQNNGLYGLVNNAGISDVWPIVETKEEEFHRVLTVNLYGVFRVTNALIPMIIESKGRIVTMGSLSGTIPSKFIGPYSISKFGVEALMDILYFEIRHFGVHIATIKPGNVRSNITKQLIPLFEKRKERIISSLYKPILLDYQENLQNQEFLDRNKYETPERVVKAIRHALFDDNPKTKYLVTDKTDTEAAIKWMLRVIAQLNQNHEFKLSSEEIHEILESQLLKFN